MSETDTERDGSIDPKAGLAAMFGGTWEPVVWCPYQSCGFSGTEDEVDDHRALNHRGEPQQGSNLPDRPRN